METTKVKFYIDQDDDKIFAFFPEEPFDKSYGSFYSYSSTGQHSACHPNYVAECKTATPIQFKGLKKELESIGYTLEVIDTNYLLECILDFETCKKLVQSTRKGEICILCSNYSINVSSHYTDEFAEQLQYDLDEFGEKLGHDLYVNDYSDLCCDPHGVESDDFEEEQELPEGYSKYTLPSIWASYLINGDASGLEDDDIKQCDEVTKDFGSCVGISENTFFGTFKGIGHDLVEYTFRDAN